MNLDRLDAAYRRALYQIPAIGICLKVGIRNIDLDRIMVRHFAHEWAFLTPCNPGSIELAQSDNGYRIKAFAEEISSYPNWEGYGVDPEGRWPAEFSFLIAGLNLTDARELAIRYGQFAFLYGKTFHTSALVWTGLEKMEMAIIE